MNNQIGNTFLSTPSATTPKVQRPSTHALSARGLYLLIFRPLYFIYHHEVIKVIIFSYPRIMAISPFTTDLKLLFTTPKFAIRISFLAIVQIFIWLIKFIILGDFSL